MAKHGSLAKAGKVKKQTPKVAKQERTNKPPTGRSKLRKQFNKRFYQMKQTKQKNFNTQVKK
jgi:small subunit ribosomal protein S30e